MTEDPIATIVRHDEDEAALQLRGDHRALDELLGWTFQEDNVKASRPPPSLLDALDTDDVKQPKIGRSESETLVAVDEEPAGLACTKKYTLKS